MIPVPLILAGLDFLKSAFPTVQKALTNQNVPERNVEIGGALLDAATKATSSANFQEAIEKIQTDPTAKKAAEDALHLALPGLIEVGGGVEGARKAAADAGGDWRRLVFSLPFVVLIVLVVPLAWSVVASATFKAPFLVEMDAQTRGLVIGFVLGTVVASAIAFVYGTTQESNRKTSLLANKE